MRRDILWLLGALLLLGACTTPGATHPAAAGTLSTWYPDGYVPVDATPDAGTEVAAPDTEAADALADADDATPAAAVDAADAATPDAIAGDVTADVADVADAADAPDIADIVDVPAEDTAPPGVCFKGAPPVGDAFVADIPPGDPDSCPTVTPPATWFTTVPAPTLTVTPGSLAADGTFSAYVNDGWAPINYGTQGGFHVWAGFTVGTLTGATAPTLPFDVQIWADSACTTVASGVASVVTTVQVADGVYSNVFTGSSGIPTQFYLPAASSYLYCGVWVNLHIRVHDPASGGWGEAVRSLRLYDSKP